MPTLVMLDDPLDTPYTLKSLKAQNTETLEVESRLFYVLDGISAMEAMDLVRPYWAMGVLQKK